MLNVCWMMLEERMLSQLRRANEVLVLSLLLTVQFNSSEPALQALRLVAWTTCWKVLHRCHTSTPGKTDCRYEIEEPGLL